MSFALVQDSGRVSGNNSINLSLGSLPTPGNALFVKIGIGSANAGENPTVTDNQGNTWLVAVTSDFEFSVRTKIAYLYNVPAASGTFTVTIARITGSVCGLQANLEEWSGFGTNDPLSTTAKHRAANTSNFNSGTTGTPSEIDALVQTAVCRFLFTGTITVESVTPAWTQAWEGTSGFRAEADYRVITAGGTQICRWTVGSNDDYSACIAVFCLNETPTAGVRANQAVTTIARVQDPSPIRANQTTLSLVTQSAPVLRWNQVVLTVARIIPSTPVTPKPGCPEGLPASPVTGEPGCVPDLE